MGAREHTKLSVNLSSRSHRKSY